MKDNLYDSVVFSPDGPRLIIDGDGRLWKNEEDITEEGDIVFEFINHSRPYGFGYFRRVHNCTAQDGSLIQHFRDTRLAGMILRRIINGTQMYWDVVSA